MPSHTQSRKDGGQPSPDARRALTDLRWRSGAGTAAEVRKQVRPRRPVSRNTVQTMLSRLAEKG